MPSLFKFFLRLFLAFLAAKLVLGLMAADTSLWLLAGSLALVGFAYLLEHLGPEFGWRLARLLISLNQLPGKLPRQSAPRD